ncbi:MAG TPA: radical SAM protein [Kiritimatiellia bacterium]|jgi:MoaA/NifB/PqqE/SkfB family radical SAM enzyme|nr:MAG: Cyclic pyranopterin monophosphate synthase [Verrucomicrobia bacterium ADurb.Bin070]HQA37342.1 radical SAM protein [Kiritimatiellia bacterium]HQL49788.1 radical SAM protein [Kiritimatiellia bacterium]HQQ90619.1 radical SAM protein [Kiritimatiellia bacterium]
MPGMPDRVKVLSHPAAIRLFMKSYAMFRTDPRCSLFNLLRSAWRSAGEEKVVSFAGKLVYSSFLPPIPSKAADQVLDALDTSRGAFDGQVTGRRRAPISIYIAVTQRCPYHCAHCSAVGRHPAQELTTEEMKNVLADLQDMGTAIIGFTGGEPMVRSDLAELIATVDERSVSFLFTTGYGLTLEKARAFRKAGLFAAGISLDDADPRRMDELRGLKGAFNTAVAAVKICREAGLYTMTQTVAEPGALRTGHLQKIIELSKSLGAHELRVLENMPSGRLAKIAGDRILTQAERDELCTFSIAVNKKKGYPKLSVFAYTEDKSRFGCGAGTQHAYLDAAGNLYPCDFVPLSFGNVRERPIAELWRAMHRRIGMPRQSCMIMELYTKKLLDPVTTFPVPPEAVEPCLEKLDVMTQMPGYYRRLLGVLE